MLTCLLSNPRLVVWRCKKKFNYGGVTSSVYDGNNLYCVISLERRCNEIIIIIIIIRPSIAAVIYCGSHLLRRPSTAAAINYNGTDGHLLRRRSPTAIIIHCDGHLLRWPFISSTSAVELLHMKEIKQRNIQIEGTYTWRGHTYRETQTYIRWDIDTGGDI